MRSCRRPRMVIVWAARSAGNCFPLIMRCWPWSRHRVEDAQDGERGWKGSDEELLQGPKSADACEVSHHHSASITRRHRRSADSHRAYLSRDAFVLWVLKPSLMCLVATCA